MYFTWTPSTGSPTLTFSGTAPDYRLLKAYDGLESMASIIMTAKSLYLDGEFIMAAPWLDSRSVTIPLMIISTDGTLRTLQAEVLALVSTLNPKYGPGVLTFYNDSGAAYALNCVNDSGSPVMDTKTKYTNEWQCTLKFKAYDPTFYNPVASINPFQTFYNGWSFPWSYPMSYGMANTTLGCVNHGNTPTWFTAVVTGPVSNPVITNTTTGEFLQSSQTLNAGDTLTISTKPRACTVTYTPAGGSPTNAMKTVSLNSTFFLLPPGITNVTYASSLNIQSGSSMELTWNDRWAAI
jgi:hypothetical protein